MKSTQSVEFSNLTLVVPTAGYTGLRKSLHSYRKYAPGAKIIVVDQTIRGEDLGDLADIHIKINKALGFAKAMNTGIVLADTDYICCANDDVELVNERWWEGIIYWFEKHPTAGAINPASIKGYNTESDSLPYKEEYSEEDYDFLLTERTLDSSPINPIKPEIVIDGIMTWFTVFKKEALEKIKNNGCYFDERFYPGGGEDYDIMCRLYDAGYRALGVFNSWAYHHWFGTRAARDYESFSRENSNAPKIDNSLKFSDVDKKYNGNWDLWGRKDKNIPMPDCTKRRI